MLLNFFTFRVQCFEFTFNSESQKSVFFYIISFSVTKSISDASFLK